MSAISMKKTKTVILFFLLFSCMLAGAQKKERHINIGANFSLPINIDPLNKDVTGFGLEMKGERLFNKHFTGSVSIGYNRFLGTIINYWDSTKSNSFSNIPVLLGLRYYVSKLYISFETGECFGASANNRSHLAVAPSAGFQFNKLDIGIKLMHVVGGFAIPESSVLQKGEYDYLSLRVAWRIK
jgi:hypothetical protein